MKSRRHLKLLKTSRPFWAALRPAHDSCVHPDTNPTAAPDSAIGTFGVTSIEKKGVAMLGMAIGLQLIAFTTMLGFGGVGLGLAVLGLTFFLLLLSVRIERRQTRISRARRLWTYYVINDRLGERAHAKRLIGIVDPPHRDLDRPPFVCLGNRWDRHRLPGSTEGN